MFIDCVRIDLHCADKQCIHVVFDACEMLPRLSAWRVRCMWDGATTISVVCVAHQHCAYS